MFKALGLVFSDSFPSGIGSGRKGSVLANAVVEFSLAVDAFGVNLLEQSELADNVQGKGLESVGKVVDGEVGVVAVD